MMAIKIKDFNNSKISDSDVIKRIIRGEKELYEILLKRYNQKLYRVIRSYVKDTQEIEDIMQNTYLKAYEKLYQFKATSAFSTWLIRIGINEALARIKTKNKVFLINGQSNDSSSNIIVQMPNRDQLNPENKIIRQEAKQFIESAIDRLKPKYKTVYIMKEVEEMSIKEISKCLGLTDSNIKVRLHRAKKILKEQLYELAHNNDLFEFGLSKCDHLVDEVMNKIMNK